MVRNNCFSLVFVLPSSFLMLLCFTCHILIKRNFLEFESSYIAEQGINIFVFPFYLARAKVGSCFRNFGKFPEKNLYWSLF